MSKATLWIFVLALPLFLFTSNVRLAVNSLWLYDYGFRRFSAAQRLHMEPEELRRVARDLIAYFNSGEYRLGGFFSERERLHLKDVRNLVQLDYRVQEGSGAYLALFAVTALLRRRLRVLGRALGYGGMATLALFILLAFAVALGFDRLFLAFHLMSFPNLLWVLDPRRDRLIMMFPEGFFFQATLFIAAATILEALLLWWLGRKLSRRYRSW